jgi:hypothetical protein
MIDDLPWVLMSSAAHVWSPVLGKLMPIYPPFTAFNPPGFKKRPHCEFTNQLGILHIRAWEAESSKQEHKMCTSILHTVLSCSILMYLDASWASITASKYTGISLDARLATYSRLVLPSSNLKCSALCLRDPTCAAYSFEKIDRTGDGGVRVFSGPRWGATQRIQIYYKSMLI